MSTHKCVIFLGPNTVGPQRQHEGSGKGEGSLGGNEFELMVSPDSLTLGPSEESTVLFCFFNVKAPL